MKQVAQNILDQSFQSQSEKHPSLYTKQREFLAWQQQTQIEEHEDFVNWFHHNTILCKSHEKGGGLALNVHEIARDSSKLQKFMSGVKRQIIEDFGQPMNAFDFIVEIECPK